MAAVDRSVPPRPSPERIQALQDVADWHRDWEGAAVPAAQFSPGGRPDGSDYNQHYADVDSDGRIEDAYQIGAARAFDA